MKKGTIEITLYKPDWKGKKATWGTEKRSVPCWWIDEGRIMGVHREVITHKGEPDSQGEWRVTHAPTGLCAASDYPTRDLAVRVGLRLLLVPGVPWRDAEGTKEAVSVDPAKGLIQELLRESREEAERIRGEQRARRKGKRAPREPEAIPEGYITTNDVKKGACVVLRDGSMVWVEDNAKGIRRRIKAKGPFGWSTGMAYVFSWHLVKPAGSNGAEPLKIYFTKAQEKKRECIQKSGIVI